MDGLNLNLFGSDASDSIQSSRFAANLKKETYDPLLITFNSIRTGKKKNVMEGPKGPNGPRNNSNQPANAAIDVFSQNMVLAKSFNSLDAAQRRTQTDSSCDYVVYVPTSFEIKKETMAAFYDSKIKQFFERKTENNNAAANIFMAWNMFESFVNFSKLNAHKRQIALIEASYDAAKKEVGPLTNGTTDVIDFNANAHKISLEELYAIVYSTPTDPPLRYLPFDSVFYISGRLSDVIRSKILTYFSNYFQALVMIQYDSSSGRPPTSVGRIPKYLPLLNSNISAASVATPVHYTNFTVGRTTTYAAPSRNIEVMSDFLIGVMTNKGLSNRSELRSDKLKAMRDKTYLCTFKSTTEYSMNYDALLKRLYYKYPCYLTPSLNVSSEELEKMGTAVVAHMLTTGDGSFSNLLMAAVNECREINACHVICAVAVATQVYVVNQVDDAGAWDDPVNARISLTSGALTNDNLRITVLNAVTGLNIAGKVSPNQLIPLNGAAWGVAKSVIDAAVHQATIAQLNSTTLRQDAINAMNQVINQQSNFASYMYDNSTLLSAMKYSDQAPVYERDTVYPKDADYLKTFYAAKDDAAKSFQLKEQEEFNKISDEMLYVIHGPLYFDYEWIFRQDPSLIKHILGEELPDENVSAATKENTQWIPRIDPLTENVHYINRNPTPSNYPKMRFDNPTIPLPRNIEPTRGYYTDRAYTQTWKELYVSPEQARDEKASVQDNVRNAMRMTAEIPNDIAEFVYWNTQTNAAHDALTRRGMHIDSKYDWTTPGYYRYELTITSPNQRDPSQQLTNRFVQLMRPVETGTVQDYTEPNLPTAYPPPLMFITPPMRGPTNSFMIHTWTPDLSSVISPSYRAFMTVDSNGKGLLNRGAYMDHLYKMMQLIFKTVILNAKNAGIGSSPSSPSATSAETKRICVKIMAIGYGSDERNLKMVSDEDKRFIGDSFFYAVRDYSMFYEANNVNVIVYYNEATQQEVRQRYNEYTGQREAVLLRMGSSTSQATTIDVNLKLKILPVDDFFTLKFPIGKSQLQEKDLLYFVNYCSTPRSFIGNCGEWPENIEDVVNDAIVGYTAMGPQHLVESLSNAKTHIDALYVRRNIVYKIHQIGINLVNWNNDETRPKQLVSEQEKIRDAYTKYNRNADVVAASNTHNKPTNVNVSWWKGHDVIVNALPRNAYISSFDEHVLMLNNLLTPFGPRPAQFIPIVVQNNATDNCGPYTTDATTTAATFENTVYAHVQAKKILTILSKIKPDNIQISDAEINLVKSALAELTANMTWSMDAKFTTGVCEGAFMPNSSVLHNPFICKQLLEINKWQYVDFDDIASREITGTYPLLDRLKKFVDAKIQQSSGVSQSNATAVNSGILVVSKQPSIGLLTKNVKTIFENLFQKNAPLRIDGKEMVLNNYAWPEERLYCKMRNDTKLASFKSGSGRQPAIDFAELRGLRSSSAKKCIEFPLFVVQLTLTLFEGKLSDMTFLDQASLSCASDETMLDSNVKIVWEQMMKNLKEKEQNFTIANIFKRIGLNSIDMEYDYTAYFDGDDIPPTPPIHTATMLINCTTAATNPVLRTTNAEKLKAINEEVSDTALTENEKFYNTPEFVLPHLPSIDPIVPYNSIRALAQIAEIFNTVEMHGVAGTAVDVIKMREFRVWLFNLTEVGSTGNNGGYETQPIQPGNAARIGWNAAVQTESTMLYMNPMVSVKGSLQDISNDVLTLKPGDKILIKTSMETRPDEPNLITRIKNSGEDLVNRLRNQKKQMWMVTGPPTKNAMFPTIINIPVYHSRLRAANLSNLLSQEQFENDTKLKVEFQKFSKEEAI